MAAAIVRLRGASRVLRTAKTSSGALLGLGLPGSEDFGGVSPPETAKSGFLRTFGEIDGGAINCNAAGFVGPSARFSSSSSSVRRFDAMASPGEREKEVLEERAIGDGEETEEVHGFAMFASADSLVDVTADDALKYITFSRENLTKFYGEGLPRGIVKEFEHTKSNSLLIRPRILQLCNCLERHVSGEDAFKLPAEDGKVTKPKKHILLDGPGGSGKSVALAMVVQWARARGWLVFYIPSGKGWTHDSLYYRNEETGLVETPITAQMALEGFLKSHSELLDTLPCQIPDPVPLGEGAGVPRVRGPQEFTLPEGATLKQLVEKGLSMSHAGVHTVVRLRKELSLVKDIPVLIVIDDYNSWFVFAEYGVRAKKPVHANQLDMVHAFRPIVGSKEMMVTAFSHSTAVGKIPEQLPDVPKGVQFDFPQYLPVEASIALKCYYSRSQSPQCLPVKFLCYRKMTSSIDKVETKFVQVMAKYEDYEAVYERLEAKYEKLEAEYEKLEAEYEKMEVKLERLTMYITFLSVPFIKDVAGAIISRVIEKELRMHSDYPSHAFLKWKKKQKVKDLARTLGIPTKALCRHTLMCSNERNESVLYTTVKDFEIEVFRARSMIRLDEAFFMSEAAAQVWCIMNYEAIAAEFNFT